MTDVVLCCAPVMSSVRPSAALGNLQAGLRARGIGSESLYLNLLFAQRIGLDLNESLAERAPAHLLIGDWIFAPCLDRAPRDGAPEEPRGGAYRRDVEALLARRTMAEVHDLRGAFAAAFVEQAAAIILERRPRIVGFSTMFQQTVASLAIAAAVKRDDPAVTIVFGGANCHGPMGPALLRNYRQIDHVFTGEADLSFPDFVEAMLAGAPRTRFGGENPARDGGGGEAEPVTGLDALPVPDYDDFFRQLASVPDHRRIRVSIPFEASRGCWWGQKHHCTFCGLNGRGMGFRAKSPERVLDELARLSERHRVERFAATDNILSMSHIEGVLGPLARTRADHEDRVLFFEIKSNLDERQIAALAEARVVQVQPGIESLSDAVLGLMRKGVDTLLNLRLMRNCREVGINVVWSILHGFPGEPAEAYGAMAALLPAIEHLPPPNGLARIRLDRFSPNFEEAAKLGFRNVRPVPAYEAIYGLPGSELDDLAYFFEADAVGAAAEEDVGDLRRGVECWRARWYGAGVPPQLCLVRVGSGALIDDSRTIAQAPLHYLDAAGVAILDGLRNPANLPDLIRRLGTDHAASSLDAAVGQLLAARFILLRDERALSLVIESGRGLVPEPLRQEWPLGAILPVAAAPDTEAVKPQPSTVRNAADAALAGI